MSANDELPNWRRGVTPHQDIREDRVSERLFAVNLSQAISREGAEEYRDPTLFFERTHLTRTLKSLILDVLKTVRGEPGVNSVIHLQTNFGGGKTHAELALYHLLKSPDQALAVPRLKELLAANGFDGVPEAAVAALPCADFGVGGREVEGGLVLHTLWGEMAYRLGRNTVSGAELYEIIRDSDEQQCSPGVVKLREVLTKAGPNLILIDELLHYMDKAAAVRVGDSNLATQTMGFLRELTEAVDEVPHSVLVASVTASDIEKLEVLTEEKAESTLSQMENILRRVEDTRTPIESAEIYEIVRTRLFQSVDETIAGQVAATYAQFHRTDPWRDLLPLESRDAEYEALLSKAYPFHPSIIKVLYERWGSRPQFQLTRGTLRFLAHLLAHQCQSDPNDKAIGPLIHLSDVDLADDDVRGEAIRVAGSEWEAVIGTDVAAAEGGASIAQRADRERGGLYAQYGLIEGIAASVFMFTHGGQQKKATPYADVRLAVARPGISLSDLDQAFDDCKGRLYYYYEEDGGLIFKTEPNPNKVLADERANVHTDDARRKVETVVEEVIGKSSLFNVIRYGFHNSQAKEPGDVPDEDQLQLVVLPPRLTATRGKTSGKTADVVDEIAQNYAGRLRMNRNMVLYLVPDSTAISEAVSRAADWIAAQRVMADADLMERFSEAQQEIIQDKAAGAENDTKDHVRKAYNVVVLPSPLHARNVVELSYVPPSKRVIPQVEEELFSKGRLHRQFVPALFDTRWKSLWAETATVISTADLWEKFTRQWESPILVSADVLKDTIRQGVEQGLFGYGVMHDRDQNKLDAGSYERMYFGQFDAGDLSMAGIEVDPRTVLMRPSQIDVLFPPVTKDEVAMLVTAPRQTVDSVFRTARTSPTVQGRVDKDSFFAAVCEGIKAGLFGYADGPNAPVVRGSEAEITPDRVKFPGLLIGEDVPLPVTAVEIASLVPTEGRLSVRDLQQLAVGTYGADRVSEASLVNALQRNVAEGNFGYAPNQTTSIQTGVQPISMDGYVGHPEALPPNTRVIRFRGTVSAVDLARVVKAATNLSKLGLSSITIDLHLELIGEINEHSAEMALRELKGGVPGLNVEDGKG